MMTKSSCLTVANSLLLSTVINPGFPMYGRISEANYLSANPAPPNVNHDKQPSLAATYQPFYAIKQPGKKTPTIINLAKCPY